MSLSDRKPDLKAKVAIDELNKTEFAQNSIDEVKAQFSSSDNDEGLESDDINEAEMSQSDEKPDIKINKDVNEDLSDDEATLEKAVFGAKDAKILDDWATRSLKRIEEPLENSDDEAPIEMSSKSVETTKLLWYDKDDEKTTNKKYSKINPSVVINQQHRRELQARANAQPTWADAVSAKKTSDKRRKRKLQASLAEDFSSSSSDEETAAAIATLKRSTSKIVAGAQKGLPIPGGTRIGYTKYRDINWGYKLGQAITSTHFHPAAPVLVATSYARKLMLFKVNSKKAKETLVQAVTFDSLRPADLRFLNNGNQAIVGALNRTHFYTYDFMTGQSHLRMLNSRVTSGNRPTRIDVSSNEKLLVFFDHERNDGQLFLLDAKTCEWVATLHAGAEKIVAASFSNVNHDHLYVLTENGVLALWSVSQRQIQSTINDDGCVRACSLGLSNDSKSIALGSNTGIVNLYDAQLICNNGDNMVVKPIWTIKNIRAMATVLRYSHNDDLLAVASSQAIGISAPMRLANVRYQSVYGNFPPTNKSFGGVQCAAFSPNGAWLAAGDEHGRIATYRLHHFNDY